MEIYRPLIGSDNSLSNSVMTSDIEQMTLKSIHLLQVLSKCDIYLHYAEFGKISIDRDYFVVFWH